MNDATFATIKKAVDQQGDAFELFRTRHEQRLDEIKAGQAGLLDRVEILEATRMSPGKVAGTAAEREHKSRFTNWLRKPHDSQTKNALDEFQRREAKGLSIGSNPDGGFAVPTEIASMIERLELAQSPVRRLVKVMQVGTSDFKHLVNTRGAAAGWVGETGTRTESATSALREVAPTMGELYAYPQTTEWALDDIFFDVGAWLAEEVADQFAQLEGDAVIRGDGINKPTGMLNTAPVTTPDHNDPLRAAAAYQYVPSGDASTILPDALITLLYTVNAAYRSGAKWVMNSATAGIIMKLKDLDDRYLWTSSLAAGQPNLLLGYPVEIWEGMDAVSANLFPVAFGDFRRGYLLADRVGLRITVDANITTPGKIKFFIRRREGGAALSGDAIKFLKIATS